MSKTRVTIMISENLACGCCSDSNRIEVEVENPFSEQEITQAIEDYPHEYYDTDNPHYTLTINEHFGTNSWNNFLWQAWFDYFDYDSEW